jgi:hypothetical protein
MPSAPRQFVERRIWRLSFLVTGNELAAAELVDRVQRAHDVLDLDPARLDRLIVQRAREMLGTGYGPARKARGRTVASPLAARTSAEAQRMLSLVQSLPEQPREAWVLTHIDELDELHVSRAMDCSRTATVNHLASADGQMREALKDEYERGVESLRRFADSLDPGPIISQYRARQRSRRVRRAGIVAVVIAIVLLTIAMAWLKGWM